MKKIISTLVFLVVLSIGTLSAGQENSIYRHEFEAALPSLPVGNTKNMSLLRLLANPTLFDLHGSRLLPATAMPALHSYVDDVCKQHNIRKPTLYLSQEGKTSAAKMFFNPGVIQIDPQFLLCVSDDEVKAIIAHELGHIKYNHMNKRRLLAFSLAGAACLVAVGVMRSDTRLPFKLFNMAFTYNAYKSLSKVYPEELIGQRFEKQADRFSNKECNNAAGNIKFFERLSLISDPKIQILPHPSHEDRIKVAQKYLSKQQTSK